MTPFELAAIRTDEGQLRAMLATAGVKTWKGKACCCPWHGDEHPSAGIFQGDEDRSWRFNCQVCNWTGDIFDVQARVEGKTVAEVLAGRSAPAARPTPPKTHYATLEALTAGFAMDGGPFVYTNPVTHKADMVVVRYRGQDGRKRFVQAHWNSTGFVMEAPAKPWPIYNRSRIAQATEVVVVEGEKCVHALNGIGIVATTSPGGAGKAGHADWSPLAGKTVRLWPDNDDIGRRHMADVAQILARLTPPAAVFRVHEADLGLAEKGDVADMIAACGEDEEAARSIILSVLEEATSDGASSEVRGLIGDMASGKVAVLRWPWPALGGMTRSLLTGTITTFCGDPGGGKSLMAIQSHMYWTRQGYKTALYELEDDRSFHLLRATAILSGRSELTDPEWVSHHGDEATAAMAEHAGFLDQFGPCLYATPDQQPTLTQIAEWIEARCAEGCQIITIDPITAAQADNKPWIADGVFIARVKTAVRKSGSRLLLFSHPRKGRKGQVDLDSLAGGAAFARFTHCVLWALPVREEEATVRTPLGDTTSLVNRQVRILKARNGPGTGLDIGFYFDGRTLALEEKGVLQK